VLRHAYESPFPPSVIAETLDRLVDEAERDDRASFATLVRAAGLDPARDFIGAFLADLDFRDEDLRGFDFSGADLTGADFRRANLAGVRFEGATLTGAIGLSGHLALSNHVSPSKAERKMARAEPSASLLGAPAALARVPDHIPIRSAASAGGDREMLLEDGPIGYTARPANLGGVRSAYAIYVVGDGMAPRYEPGWLLHVNPFKPPRRGRDVVVYKADNAVLIKQFIGWEDDTLVLRQLNPSDILRIPREEVRECHLVVGADQEA
jgi:phage repressor protein C with HTH and peptisase S24 domain